HRRDVDADLAGADAMDGKSVLGFVVVPGAVQQGLGGNATHVQAGAGQSQLAVLAPVLLDTGGLEALLVRTDGIRIAMRARTTDDYIEFIAHHLSTVFSCGVGNCGADAAGVAGSDLFDSV